MNRDIELVIQAADETTSHTVRSAMPVLIGRDPACDVVLSGWRVARQHVRLDRLAQGSIVVTDLGSLGGTWTRAGRIKGTRRLETDESIMVAGYVLTPLNRQPDDSDMVPASVLDRPMSKTLTGRNPSDNATDCVEPANIAGIHAFPTATSGLAAAPRAQTPQPGSSIAPHEQLGLRRTLRARLLAQIDLRRQDITRLSAAELRSELGNILAAIVAEMTDVVPAVAHESLIELVLDETVGLGVLEPLIADRDVNEIMVNGATDIFIERNGLIERVATGFSSDQALRAVIERMVAPVGRRIDEASPMVDARLSDGSRVNAVLPPLALKGPVITIRKFSERVLTGEDLLALASLSPAMLEFLRLCIRTRRNIAISGGTGTGKTTLLNVLAGLIPPQERVITIEDSAELRLPHENLVSLEARQSNGEGRGAITIRDLVRNALRMRPDRLVVGECRGGETLDMLQAMNTGHDGSMTTLHANSARDVSSRLETMALMAGIDIPVVAIREQIASAIHIVIQQIRLPNGARKISEISEVTGIESGRLQMQCIFRYQPLSSDRSFKGTQAAVNSAATAARFGFVATGVTPQFIDVVAGAGQVFDRGIFQPEDAA